MEREDLIHVSLHQTPDFIITKVKERSPDRVVAEVATPTDSIQLDYVGCLEDFLYHQNSTHNRIGIDGRFLDQPVERNYFIVADVELTRFMNTFIPDSFRWWDFFEEGDSVGKAYILDNSDWVEDKKFLIPNDCYARTERFTEEAARKVIKKIISWKKLPNAKEIISREDHKKRYGADTGLITRLEGVDFEGMEHYVNHPNHASSRWGTALYDRQGIYFLEFDFRGQPIPKDFGGSVIIKLYRPRYRNGYSSITA